MSIIKGKAMKKNKVLKVGTLFSGIGAFEEALRQLNISHEIKFACDNGEIELIPFDGELRKEFIRLQKKARTLVSPEKERFDELRMFLAREYEKIREYCYSIPS